MKFPKLLLVIAVLVLSASSFVAQTAGNPSQQKAITKEDFEKVDKKSIELLKTTPYRITTTSETLSKDEAKPSSVGRSVVEFIPPDRRHEWDEMETTTSFKGFKDELINIGSQSFWRRNDGSWERLSRRENDGPPEWREHRAPHKRRGTERYFSLASVQLGGQEAKVVMVIGREKGLQVYRDTPVFITYMITTWYDREGRLLKEQGEMINEDSVNGRFVSGRWKKMYEYDPKDIGQIEAPIK